MAIANHHIVIGELAKALGFEGDVLRSIGSIRIDIEPTSYPRVTVVRYLSDETAERVQRIVEKYDLVKREDAD